MDAASDADGVIDSCARSLAAAPHPVRDPRFSFSSLELATDLIRELNNRPPHLRDVYEAMLNDPVSRKSLQEVLLACLDDTIQSRGNGTATVPPQTDVDICTSAPRSHYFPLAIGVVATCVIAVLWKMR